MRANKFEEKIGAKLREFGVTFLTEEDIREKLEGMYPVLFTKCRR